MCTCLGGKLLVLNVTRVCLRDSDPLDRNPNRDENGRQDSNPLKDDLNPLGLFSFKIEMGCTDLNPYI